MPANQKANDLKLLFDEERAAIEALDMEKLLEVISRMEAVLSEMELLDRQASTSENKQPAERERTLIIESLKALSDIGDENLKRLLGKREETLAQLKELRSKKAAHKAYSRTQMLK